MIHLKCDKCGGEMNIASKMNSGNSQYITWQCKKCANRVMKCEGVN